MFSGWANRQVLVELSGAVIALWEERRTPQKSIVQFKKHGVADVTVAMLDVDAKASQMMRLAKMTQARGNQKQGLMCARKMPQWCWDDVMLIHNMMLISTRKSSTAMSKVQRANVQCSYGVFIIAPMVDYKARLLVNKTKKKRISNCS